MPELTVSIAEWNEALVEWLTSTSTSSLVYWLINARFLLFFIVLLACFLFWIICLRKIFKKAWLPWRGSLIPVYREYLWFKMIWRNGRWTATLLSLPMFIVVLLVSFFKVPEKFGKDKEQFALWLWFLNPIFLWILAFDKSKYQK